MKNPCWKVAAFVEEPFWISPMNASDGTLTARHAPTSSAPVATPTTGAKSTASQLGATVASTITLCFALFFVLRCGIHCIAHDLINALFPLLALKLTVLVGGSRLGRWYAYSHIISEHGEVMVLQLL
jgi:hypothetical protein